MGGGDTGLWVTWEDGKGSEGYFSIHENALKLTEMEHDSAILTPLCWTEMGVLYAMRMLSP